MPSFQIFLRFRKEDYETWEMAKAYAKKHGLTLGKLVALSLQYYIAREDKILQKLDEIEDLLKNGNFTVRQVPETTQVREPESSSMKDLPNISFFKNNAWVDILAQRGKEK
jgi:hypothetical protein